MNSKANDDTLTMDKLTAHMWNTTTTFAVPQFRESPLMYDVVREEYPRSPSRSARRKRMGHRQHVRVFHKPKSEAITIDGGRTFYVHPEVMRAIKEAAKKAAVEMERRAFLDFFWPMSWAR